MRDVQQLSINTIRALAMDAVGQAESGHPGTVMALAPLAYILYSEIMRHSPSDPGWPNRDRFILSAGHASILQYATLHLSGYAISLQDLKHFRRWGSIKPGHPEHSHTPGIETTMGPPGQGFANGVGMAIAERFLADTFNRPDFQIVDHRVYAICSDGDMMEGLTSEAASLAGQLGLGKLIYFYYDNRTTIDGSTATTFSAEKVILRLEAQGWHVQQVDSVEDLPALRIAISLAQEEVERPSMIIVRSHIASPAPSALDTSKAHGSPLGEDEIRTTKEIMGLDPDKYFAVEPAVYEHMSQAAYGTERERLWRKRFEDWSLAYPGLREQWDQAWSGKPNQGWLEALPEFKDDELIATWDASRRVMEAFKSFTPTMIGGAADLIESSRTEFAGERLLSQTHSGRNIAFGIREKAMGSIVNGLALHGGIVKPCGSTFVAFSDYPRPAIRLSALMGLNVVWIFSHDSIGVGEDGLTHQPVEHLASQRAIPNMWLIRPADANETARAWKVALERDGGPVALALSRQKLPVLSGGDLAPSAGLERGAYMLWQSEKGDPDLIVIASGLEVGVALAAGRKVAATNGVIVRVVSVPCFELFELQPLEYRQEVLPNEVGVRLAIDAGVSQGWRKWIGEHGELITLDCFGASTPWPELLERFGFSVNNIVARAAALLERVP